MQLDMRYFQFKLLIFSLFFSDNLISQIDSFHHTISQNDSSINIQIASKTSRSVVFFCPTAIISKDAFYKKAEELIKSSKIRDIKDLSIHFLYFKQDLKSNAKGLKYISNNKLDTLFVGQFECLFIGFNQKFLQRSKSKMRFNYDIEEVFKNQNIYKIPIVDTNKCFEKIPDRIPFYADFLKESIQPNYSTDEKFQFLRDTLDIMQLEIKKLKEEIQNFDKKIESLKNEKQSQKNKDVIKTEEEPVEKPKKKKKEIPNH
jgi:FtsZ-binding cell division protein ZapB